VKYWEIIADNLKKAGWSYGYVSAVDSQGRTMWIADAHRDDGKRFIVRADEKLTALLELEAAIRGPAIWIDKLATLYHPRYRYKGLNPGHGKESSLSVFSSPFSDLQWQGSTHRGQTDKGK
jgi:hypothetical protein